MKGVTYNKNEGKWVAKPWDPDQGKQVHLGYFDSEEMAIRRASEFYKEKLDKTKTISGKTRGL